MDPLASLIGQSPGMLAIHAQVRRLLSLVTTARRVPPVLLLGETGTGKGLLARSLHAASPRASGGFVSVNCAAIPDTLLEAELFGYERGAFTDARQAKPGLFQQAHGGTLFLDEAGLLPEHVQAKLLTALDERAVRRLGGTRVEPTDCWIIAATSADLEQARRERRFREDLYHRLSVFSFCLPPLRERGDDVLHLADALLARICADYGLAARTLDAGARRMLACYGWPGNVRELGNVLERTALLSDTSVINADLLGLRLEGNERVNGASGNEPEPQPSDLRESLDEHERSQLLQALTRARWNVSVAAEMLGIPRNTLRYRIERHALTRPDEPVPRSTLRSRLGPQSTPAPARPSGHEAIATDARRRPTDDEASVRRRAISFLRVSLAVVIPTTTTLGEAMSLITEKIATFGGRVVRCEDGQVDGAFGIEPTEDAAARAGYAALAIRRLVARAAKEHPEGRVRMAIDTLSSVVTENASGETRVMPECLEAARQALDALIEQTDVDAIAIGPSAMPFLERQFSFATGETVGQRAPTLLARPHVLDARRPATFGRSPFVGRTHELTFVQQRVKHLAATGRGHVVGLMGEPGIGKSRLLAELRRGLAADGLVILEGQCAAHAVTSPYSLLTDILRRSWHLDELDPSASLATAIERQLGVIGLSDCEPEIAGLLGLPAVVLGSLSPAAVKTRTFEAFRRLLLTYARPGPLVLLLEDLHWADQTSQEFLGLLIESLPGAPVLIAATMRPGYRAAWLDRSWASQLALPPLSPDESREVVRALRPDLDAAWADEIARRAEGNPFFLEELVSIVSADCTADIAISGTVTDALHARMDRLAPEARRVIERAAVLGREVSLDLLAEVTETPIDALAKPISQLMSGEFLYERGRDLLIFKHALIQEVAYARLTPPEREALHARVGRALESRFSKHPEQGLEQLAHHWARTDDHARAVDYLSGLSVRMFARYAINEVIETLMAALRHAEAMGDGAARDRAVAAVVWRLGLPLLMAGRLRDAVDVLQARQSSVDRAADPLISGPYYFCLAYAHNQSGNRASAQRLAERALAEGRKASDPLGEGGAHHVLAFEAFWRGRFKNGAEHARLAIERLARVSEPWLFLASHWLCAMNEIAAGRFASALAIANEMRAGAERIQDRRNESFAAWMVGWIHSLRGEHPASIEAYQLAADRAPDPLAVAAATGWCGYAQLEAADYTSATATLRSASEQFKSFGFGSVQGLVEAWRAQAELAAGRISPAREASELALRLTSAAEFPYGIGTAERAAGIVATAEGDLAAARAHLQRALQTFSRVDACYEVARTHVALAHYERARDDAAAAAAQLEAGHRLFIALDVPRWAQRTRDLAHEMGVSVHGGSD